MGAGGRESTRELVECSKEKRDKTKWITQRDWQTFFSPSISFGPFFGLPSTTIPDGDRNGQVGDLRKRPARLTVRQFFPIQLTTNNPRSRTVHQEQVGGESDSHGATKVFALVVTQGGCCVDRKTLDERGTDKLNRRS